MHGTRLARYSRNAQGRRGMHANGKGLTNLASSCKALQPSDLEEGDSGEHDGGQCIDGQPVLLHHNQLH